MKCIPKDVSYKGFFNSLFNSLHIIVIFISLRLYWEFVVILISTVRIVTFTWRIIRLSCKHNNDPVEQSWFSDVFRGYRKGALGANGLRRFCIKCSLLLYCNRLLFLRQLLLDRCYSLSICKVFLC